MVPPVVGTASLNATTVPSWLASHIIVGVKPVNATVAVVVESCVMLECAEPAGAAALQLAMTASHCDGSADCEAARCTAMRRKKRWMVCNIANDEITAMQQGGYMRHQDFHKTLLLFSFRVQCNSS